MERNGSLVMACAASVGAGCLICIARGSRILTPAGLRAIETLAVGERVYCIDPRTHELVCSRVVAHRSGVRECMALHAGGHCLVLTSTHPVHDTASGEFRHAGALALDPRARVLVVDDDGVRSLQLDRVDTITVTAQATADDTTGDATSSSGSDGTASSGSETTGMVSATSSGDAISSSTSDGASESESEVSSTSSGGTTRSR